MLSFFKTELIFSASKFPKQKDVLYDCSIAFAKIIEATLPSSFPPWFIACAIFFSVTLYISFLAFSIKLGTNLLKAFKPVFIVSRPAYAKSYLFKKTPFCLLFLVFLLGMSGYKHWYRYTNNLNELSCWCRNRLRLHNEFYVVFLCKLFHFLLIRAFM